MRIQYFNFRQSIIKCFSTKKVVRSFKGDHQFQYSELTQNLSITGQTRESIRAIANEILTNAIKLEEYINVKAHLSTEPIGHFGLYAMFYTSSLLSFYTDHSLVKVLVSKNIFTPKYDLLIPKRIIVSGPHKGNFYKNQQEYITSYSVLEIFRGLSKSNIIWYSFYTLTQIIYESI